MFVFFGFPLKCNLLQPGMPWSYLVMKALCFGMNPCEMSRQLSGMWLYRSLGARGSRAEAGTVIFPFFPQQQAKRNVLFLIYLPRHKQEYTLLQSYIALWVLVVWLNSHTEFFVEGI